MKGVIFVVLVIFIIPIMDVYGRDSYENHVIDFDRVLGAKERGGLEDLYKKLHEVIDQKGGQSQFINRLKERYGLTFGGGRMHRYMFHWGFNVAIEEHTPLMDELNSQICEHITRKLGDEGSEYYKEYNGKKEEMSKGAYVTAKSREIMKKVVEEINDERAKQNRELINLCMEKTGLNRSMASGLITVLWDIHIMSDYLGREKKGLLSFSRLSVDFRRRGLERLFEQDNKDGDFKREYDSVIKELDNKFGSLRSDSDRACEYLNYLCGYEDCQGQNSSRAGGAIAKLIRRSQVLKGILTKNGVVLEEGAF